MTTLYTYNYQKEVKSDLLEKEIKSTSLAERYYSLTVTGFECTVSMLDLLSSNDKTLLDSIVASHDPSAVDYEDVIRRRIIYGMSNGAELMAEFGAENKKMLADGIISQGDLYAMVEALSSVQALVGSGSLEMAQAVLPTVPDMAGLDQARKDKYVARVQDILDEMDLKFPLT